MHPEQIEIQSRFKKGVGNLVSDFQHPFVVGRHILDAVYIVNWAIDSTPKANLRVILYKFNIKKGYDHVSWNFVHELSEKTRMRRYLGCWGCYWHFSKGKDKATVQAFIVSNIILKKENLEYLRSLCGLWLLGYECTMYILLACNLIRGYIKLWIFFHS